MHPASRSLKSLRRVDSSHIASKQRGPEGHSPRQFPSTAVQVCAATDILIFLKSLQRVVANSHGDVGNHVLVEDVIAKRLRGPVLSFSREAAQAHFVVCNALHVCSGKPT